MKVLFHRNFEKEYTKLRIAEKNKLKERIAVFTVNPFDPVLGNHPLKGKYQGYRSINVGGDLRAMYKLAGEDVYLFAAIGTHAKLCKS